MSDKLRYALALCIVLSVAPLVSAGEYTIVELDHFRPEMIKSAEFTVTDDLNVLIEAVGGYHNRTDRMFAYGWLLDAVSREVVWSMEEEFTHRHKNNVYLRDFDDEISLKPGTYDLYFYAGKPVGMMKGSVNDFSDLKDLLKDVLGSKDRPSDRDLAREYYIRLSTDSKAVSKSSGITGPPPSAIELTNPDNDAYERKGFVLTREIELEIYAAGEYSEWSEMMVDWGWITDTKTRKRVWEMDRWNTDWAGGAEKNRVVRETITLPVGEYLACYVTDDSHTAGDWNEPPPYDPEAWGLRIRAADPADADAIQAKQVSLHGKPVIQITQVCNNEFISKGFKLSKPADLLVYAIGEDNRYNRKLADYGWITDASSGDIIWMMDDDNTEYAGGAAKNRMYDGVVTLDKGEYVVHYLTDGSHSYCDWNASPPYDQSAYGISIYVPGDQDAAGLITLFEPSEGPAGALAAITCVGDNERRKARFTLQKVTRVNIRAVGEGDRNEMYDYGWIEDADHGEVVWEMTPRKTHHAGGAEKNRAVNQTILLDKGNYVVYYITDGSHSCHDYNAAEPDDPLMWGIIVTEAEK